MRVWEQLLQRGSTEATRSDPQISLDDWMGFFNNPDMLGFLQTSWGNIQDEELVSSVAQAYEANGPVFALVLARLQVFSQARFQWTRFTSGTPRDLFGNSELSVLERPWVGGTTADLLARMEVNNSTAGNAFVRRLIRGRRGVTGEDRLMCLRPQWMTIIIGSQEDAEHPMQSADAEVVGYAYRPNGDANRMQIFLPSEIAHFAPLPDPDNNFVGMSWITPVIRSVMSDDASETHKRKFFQNAATPNLAIKFDPTVTIDQVKAFKGLLEGEHQGRWNAYKTLYLGGGADPIAIGKDFQQLAFAETQGKGESRLAAAAGVPPSWVGFSEGLQGSALNAGNFTAARRRFGDGTLHHLWANAASSLEVLLQRPPSQAGEAPAQLWVDTRSVPFLREDAKEHAETQQQEATTMKTLIDAGYEPASVTSAISQSDWGLLKHTGLVSVQLLPPGSGDANAPTLPNGGK